MDQAKQSKFEEVIGIIQSLRTSWIEATGLNSGGARAKAKTIIRKGLLS